METKEVILEIIRDEDVCPKCNATMNLVDYHTVKVKDLIKAQEKDGMYKISSLIDSAEHCTKCDYEAC